MRRDQEYHHLYFAPEFGRVDRRALAFVAMTVAASTVWIGLYVGLAAKAIGLI
jgi:hypothetical protein